MTKKLKIRPSGEVGFVDGYMMAVVYPVPECPQSSAERNFNVARMIETWNKYDDLKALNAELLEALEYIIQEGQIFTSAIEGESHSTDFEAWEVRARSAIAKARSQS